MSGSSKEERGKNVSKSSSLSAPGPVGLNVLKRDGSVQPFDGNKLVSSMKNAGATQQQASLVSNRVISRLGDNQTVPSSVISGMVARSLFKVNPVASSQYTSFGGQKTPSPVAPVVGGAASTKATAGPEPSMKQMPPQKIAQVSTGSKPSTTQKIVVPATQTKLPPLWGQRTRIPPIEGTPPSFEGTPQMPPDVLSWSPPSEGFNSSTLTIYGQNFLKDRFQAKIGSIALEITSRSETKMEARLPSYRTNGPLIAGYGDPINETSLSEDYKVFGDPVITDVSPKTFGMGDRVTITGTDLNGAFINHDLVKLSDTDDKWSGYDFVKTVYWQCNPEGTRIEFSADRAYEWINTPKPLDPQPTDLTGKLRVQKPGPGNYSVASPMSVTYKGGNPLLEVYSVKIPFTGGDVNSGPGTPDVDFVMVGKVFASNEDVITGGDVEGHGLYSARVKMNDIDVLSAFNLDGRTGWIRFQNIALMTGPLIFSRSDGQTVTSKTVKIQHTPRFTADTQRKLGTLFKIDLNVEHELVGFDLLPTGIPNLIYSLILSGLSNDQNAQTANRVKFTLLEHSMNRIRFKVETTDPNYNYSSSSRYSLWGGTPGTYNVMLIVADYNGTKKDVFYMPYYLVIPGS